MYGSNHGNGSQPMQYSGHGKHPANSSAYQQNFQGGFPQAAAHPHQSPSPQLQGNQPFSQFAAPNSINVNQPISLIQPPALNVEETINTNSQFLPQRGQGQMTVSNNDNSEFDMNPQQEGEWNNQYQIAAAFWEQKCYDMLSKFEWFFQRFQILKNEYGGLSEEIQKMDTQEDWHQFQQHHDQFFQKIAQLDEELVALMGQNEQLYQQKMTHDSQNMWEQRYQQLLGNFKSLQEQMAEKQASSQMGGVPVEQYQNLQDQMNELHYQYNQVVNQLQKYQSINYQEEFQMQINQYQNQIEKYKENQGNLHNQNVELQNMIMELQQENKALGDHYQQGSVDRSKFQELAGLIQQKEMEIQALQHDYKNKSSSNQGSISQYEAALDERNRENEELRTMVNQMDMEIKQERQKFESVESQVTKRLQSKYEEDNINNQKRIEDLERRLLDLQSSQRSSNKVENLQKKLAFSTQQITNLSDTLKLKNKELTQLRDSTYQIQKLKQKQEEFQRISDDRDRLSQNIKKKNIEIDNLHKQVQSLTNKVNEASNKRQEYSTRNLMVQIQDLNDQMRRHEGEILKLKNIIELKEEYCLKLEQDVKKINDKYIVAEQTLYSERDSWRDKEIKLNSKNNQHDKRIKNLDYQFNLQLRDTLQKEINGLRRQNVEKQNTIRDMEEKEIVLASKIAIFEKQKGNFDQDLSLMKKKEKELQNLNQHLGRKFRQLQSDYQSKEDELQQLKLNAFSINSQFSAIKAQNQNNKESIQGKAKVIEELQRQINQHLVKGEVADRLRVQNSKLKIAVNKAEQELEKLKLQAESRLGGSKLNLSMSRSPQERQENPIISQLQRQNQYLKQQLAKMVNKMTVQQPVSNKSIEVQDKKSTTSTVNLNKRLNQFNTKLQFAIGQSQGNIGLQHSKSQKLASFWENQRKELIDRYQFEIRELKEQVRHNRAGRASQISQNSIMDMSKRNHTYTGAQSDKNRDESQFYKKKAKEIESRNQQLIKINEELKQKINGVLKVKQSSTPNDFYKEQNKQLQSDVDILKSKLRKALEENKEYRIQLSIKNSKTAQEYEYKLLEQELLVQDLKRKVTHLQTEKMPIRQEKLRESNKVNKTISEVDIRGSINKRQSYPVQLPETAKYGGIQEQFQSVLGNLKASPKAQGGRQFTSVNYSSHTYGDSRIEEYHHL